MIFALGFLLGLAVGMFMLYPVMTWAGERTSRESYELGFRDGFESRKNRLKK